MDSIKIPKIIHLVWLGENGFSPLEKKCIQSWHDILPDYKIRRWTTDMALSLKIPYVQEAIAMKKWAFAADVVRAYALYTEGGVYMDADVFLKRRFDTILTHSFVGFNECAPYLFDAKLCDDQFRRRVDVNSIPWQSVEISFMASEKGNEFLSMVLDDYKGRQFIEEDGSLTMNSIIGPTIYAIVAEKLGLQYKDETQILKNDVILYESKYYNSVDDPVAFAVHLGSHSWVDKKRTPKTVVKNLLKRVLSYLNLYKKDIRHLKYDKKYRK